MNWSDLNDLGTQQARAERSEVERRRAVVTLYYGYFHRLCSEAASPFAGGGQPLVAQVSRALTHTSIRTVCEAYRRAGRTGGSVPSWFGIVPIPPSTDIVAVAESFVELQEARVSADYDLTSTIDRLDCVEARSSAERGHASLDSAKAAPELTVFLTALLFADRWTRRG